MRAGRTAIRTACVLLALAPAAGADPALKGRAREILDANKDAIVTVKLVVTTRFIMMGRDTNKQENTSEVTGTVLDPSGLTVLSHFATDPTSAMHQSAMDMGEGEKMQFKIESDISDVKIVRADGSEVPARIVLKDKDLDLAFVKPKEKAEAAFPHVKFAPASAPGILDDIVAIGRMGREVKRVNSVALGYIQAVVEKPRTFYICDFMIGYSSMGCPVFNARGETLGLSVMRMNQGGGGGFGMMGGMMPVVLPADQLLEVAQQAAAAKGEPEKTEAADDGAGKPKPDKEQ
jgi:hypothetical protein